MVKSWNIITTKCRYSRHQDMDDTDIWLFKLKNKRRQKTQLIKAWHIQKLNHTVQSQPETEYIIFEKITIVFQVLSFWTELSYRHKSYSNKATLFLDRSHRYKNSTVVITIWLAVTKNPYHKWQWIFDFLRRCFLSSITAKTFTGLDCIYEYITGVL
jgi:hypothetical protein